MKCEECEVAIYTFRELLEVEKQLVVEHIKTCQNCKKVFDEVELLQGAISKSNSAQPVHSQPEWLTSRIVTEVQKQHSRSREREPSFLRILQFPALRYGFAFLSFVLIVFFYSEFTANSSPTAYATGPTSKMGGVIINGADLRNALSAKKEKSSVLSTCVSLLDRTIDTNCLKEKIGKLNF